MAKSWAGAPWWSISPVLAKKAAAVGADLGAEAVAGADTVAAVTVIEIEGSSSTRQRGAMEEPLPVISDFYSL